MGKTKTQKMRGSRSCGYGRKKRHRGKGNRGGSGMAGSKTHKIFKTLKENPNYFVHRTLKKRGEDAVINLRDLEKFKGNKINLKELGIGKLLGDGELEKKVDIVVDKWSKSAEEKVKKAGGTIKKPESSKKKTNEEKNEGKETKKTQEKEKAQNKSKKSK